MKTDWYLDFFQGIVVDMWQHAVSPEQSLREVEFVIELLQLPPAGRVLVVPCGFGRHSVELAERGFQVTGIDISADCLARAHKLANERNVMVNWTECEMRQLPAGETFDGAIAWETAWAISTMTGLRLFWRGWPGLCPREHGWCSKAVRSPSRCCPI